MVKERNFFVVLLLMIVTFGLYSIYWFVQTKNELVELGADIPTAWLMIVPFVNIYWSWKYCAGVGHIKDDENYGILLFILNMVFMPASIFLIQEELNKHV